MAQFRLLAGSHYIGKKEYKAGEIIVSPRDLVAIFGREKFVAVNLTTEATPVPIETVNPPISTDVEEQPIQSPAPPIKFIKAKVGKNKFVVKNSETGVLAVSNTMTEEEADKVILNLNGGVPNEPVKK